MFVGDEGLDLDVPVLGVFCVVYSTEMYTVSMYRGGSADRKENYVVMSLVIDTWTRLRYRIVIVCDMPDMVWCRTVPRLHYCR